MTCACTQDPWWQWGQQSVHASGSEMITMAHARLWSLLRQCSVVCGHMEQEAPLLVHPRQWSLASPTGPDFFWYSLLASCGALATFWLCSRSQPQPSPWDLTSKARTSAPSPHPPRQVSKQASQAGECWSAPILCVGISPLCPLYPCCCTLLCGSKTPPLLSPPARGLPSVWKLFLLHSSLPGPSQGWAQVPSLLFCLFFSFALPRYVGNFLPFWKSEVFCQLSVGVL